MVKRFSRRVSASDMRNSLGYHVRRWLWALLLVGAVVGRLEAQTYSLAPPPYQTVLNNNGDKVSNACVWTYQAGTTTPIATYNDAAGTTNTNPIRTDSAGRMTVYLTPGTAYKFVYEQPCTPPAHGVVLRTADNVSGTPLASSAGDTAGVVGEAVTAGQVVYLSDGSGGRIAGLWYKADSAQAYSSMAPPIGMAIEALGSGATGTIRLYGIVGGLTALASGSTYYVGSSGALTLTAPAFRRIVGVAQSPTTLLLSANPSNTETPWTTVPYSAANFTAVGGTWTVDAGDVNTYGYVLTGKTMTVAFHVSTTSVAGPATQLVVTIPGGFRSAGTAVTAAASFGNTTQSGTSYALLQANGSTISCGLNTSFSTAFAAGTNDTTLSFVVTFPIL